LIRWIVYPNDCDAGGPTIYSSGSQKAAPAEEYVGHEERRENVMTVGYVYLDHNVVDRIDTPLRDALLFFFQENELTPVVSTASLGEIERSGRADRISGSRLD
jgi:hypothetical protein